MMAESDVSLMHSRLQRRASRDKREVLLQLLTARHCAPRPPYLSKAFRRGETTALTRFENLNLAGIGFGPKETRGTFGGGFAVRLYVTRKFPKNKLLRRYWIPELVNGIPTDVIQIGRLSLQSRPVALGTSISHVNGSAGSLGCIVSLPGEDAWFMLSASHVLAPSGVATSGDQIVEPAAAHGPGAAIATLTDFESLQPNGVPNLFDAAIARVIRKTDVRPLLPVIGKVGSTVMDPVLFESVRKYGAGTGHTLGIVTDVAAETAFTFDGEDYLFQDVVQITGCGDGDFSVGGDSGALVVDALSSRPVGLIIGGAGSRTFVSPLRRVLDRFGAQIVT
ncbi:MAG TPA: hypothetical protein DC047_14500 [Blastocatellia bacterium]|nr:hypothetical protein [Blastocatellia bacterium]